MKRVRDAHVAGIMCGKGELVPEGPQKEATGKVVIVVEKEQECAEEKGVATEFDEVGAVRALEKAFVAYSIVKGSVLLYDVGLSV